MKKITKILLVLALFIVTIINAQTVVPKSRIGIGTPIPNASAALDITSTTQGFLPPRMNLTQISAIANPVEGLMVYCTDCSPKTPLSFDGTNWVNANGQQPVAPPVAPTAPVATAGAGSASVAFTAPTSTGSGAIVSYTVTSFPGGRTATGTASPIVVGNLTAGTAYTFTVRATNASGLTATSVQSNSVAPTAGVPLPPTALVATSTIGQSASVAFTAPTNNGGSPITGYTVTSTPGGFTASGTTSPIVVSGLTNGTEYKFTIVATNAQGNSVASTTSNSVTPQASVPAAPTIGTATVSGTTASVAFTAPTNNGGAAITSYTVTSSPGGITAIGTATLISVPGLVAGTSYTFTVTATNSAGTSQSSAVSNSVTAAGVPSAPSAVTATGLSGTSASVSFATSSANGSAITGYTITPSLATSPATFTGTSSPITVTGLTAGTAYTFSVTATNAIGTSAPGTTTFTPQNQVPGAPTGQFAIAGNAQATISFTAPTNNGGAAITNYTIVANPGNISQTATSSPYTFTGLTNGTLYTFSITANNSVGSSAAINTNSVTPTATTSSNSITSNIGPAAAYSLRKVVNAYSGPVLEVRAGTTNAEGNLSFNVSGEISLTGSQVTITVAGSSGLTVGQQVTLSDFLNTGAANQSVFAKTWYDQSGNALNVTQTTAVNQPALCTLGVLNLVGTKPALFFDGTNDNLVAQNTTLLETNPQVLNTVSVLLGTGNNSLISNDQPSFFGHGFGNSGGGGNGQIMYNNGLLSASSQWPQNVPSIGTAIFSTTNVALDVNGNRVALLNNREDINLDAGNYICIGSGQPTSFYGPAKRIAEALILNKDWANRPTVQVDLEIEQITYYGVTANSFTNATPPVAPGNVSAVAGNGIATISFTAPTNTGGSAITGYTVTSNPGNFTATGTTTPIQVSGLTNGTAYTFTVVATNAYGNSAASAPSNSVTPSAGAAAQTVSNAPTIGTATAGINSATVPFTAPSNTGNSAITGYTVTSSPGGITATGTGSPITVSGLTANTSYTFTVVATNSVGNSIPSAASNAVTTYNTPLQPVIGTITTLGLFASVPVTVNNNGSAISNYAATVNPGNLVFNSATASIPVNLPASGTYTVVVTATNAAGTSAASAAVSFTVVAIPSPQTAGNITIGDTTGTGFTNVNGVTPTTVISVGGTCPSSVTWQGVTYPTVNIGGQCWTARNHRAAPSNSGLNFTFYLGATDETSVQEGLYYTWAAAMNNATAERSQGVCPTGWHIPSSSEFSYLVFATGLDVSAINVNTNSTLTNWVNSFLKVGSFPNATNLTGFSLVNGGWRQEDLVWRDNFGTDPNIASSLFWSSSQSDSNNALRLALNANGNQLIAPRNTIRWISVRCLKD